MSSTNNNHTTSNTNTNATTPSRPPSTAPTETDNEEVSTEFFQSIGVPAASQQEAALRCCQDQLVLTVADLRVVAACPEDLRELFPPLGVRSRVKAWFKREHPPPSGEETPGDRPSVINGGAGGGDPPEISPSQEASVAPEPGEALPEPPTPSRHPSSALGVPSSTLETNTEPPSAATNGNQTNETKVTPPAQNKHKLPSNGNSHPKPTGNGEITTTSQPPTLKELRVYMKRGLDQLCLNQFQADHGLGFLDKLLPPQVDLENLEASGLNDPKCNYQKFLKAVATDIIIGNAPETTLALLQGHTQTEWIPFLQKSTPQPTELQTVPQAPPQGYNPQGARQEFLDWKLGILTHLPSNLFGQVGFSKWGNSYRPVLVVSPFGVPPLPMREQWLKLYESLAKKNSLDRMGHLIWWMASDQEIRPRAYSVIPKDGFLSFEEGQKLGYHELPKTLHQLLTKGKPFSDKQRELAGSLTMLSHLAALPPAQRPHPWANFLEEEWWWWGSDNNSNGNKDDEQDLKNNTAPPPPPTTKGAAKSTRGKGIKRDHAQQKPIRTKKRRTLG